VIRAIGGEVVLKWLICEVDVDPARQNPRSAANVQAKRQPGLSDCSEALALA
jgi:hypothetical protein